MPRFIKPQLATLKSKAPAKLNFEGIVSKDAVAPYRSDRNEGWLKIKTVMRRKFPVIGFVKDPMLGARQGWP
jgi:ATP-dependent DNA ligase